MVSSKPSSCLGLAPAHAVSCSISYGWLLDVGHTKFWTLSELYLGLSLVTQPRPTIAQSFSRNAYLLSGATKKHTACKPIDTAAADKTHDRSRNQSGVTQPEHLSLGVLRPPHLGAGHTLQSVLGTQHTSVGGAAAGCAKSNSSCQLAEANTGCGCCGVRSRSAILVDKGFSQLRESSDQHTKNTHVGGLEPSHPPPDPAGPVYRSRLSKDHRQTSSPSSLDRWP